MPLDLAMGGEKNALEPTAKTSALTLAISIIRSRQKNAIFEACHRLIHYTTAASSPHAHCLVHGGGALPSKGEEGIRTFTHATAGGFCPVPSSSGQEGSSSASTPFHRARKRIAETGHRSFIAMRSKRSAAGEPF